jgi:cobalt-zinc-cadmium efflux system membrane fusion protein
MNPMPLRWLIAAGLSAGMLCLSGCEPESQQADAKAATVNSSDSVHWPASDKRWNWLHFVTVKAGHAIPSLPVPGKVAPLETMTWSIQAPVPGRVEAVNARVGQTVRAGERLLQVRSSMLAELRRDQIVASQNLALRQKTARNAQTLSQAHAIAEKDLLSAQQDVRAAQVDLATVTQKLQAMRVEMDSDSTYWLKAPHDGVIVKADVTPGVEARPDAAPLLQMAAMDKLVVWAQVLEADLDGIDTGDTARILAPGREDRAVLARVASISRAVDPELHTVAVRLETQGSSGWLRPNGFVQVAFERPNATAIVLPTEAVVTDDLESVVFVKQADGTLLKRPVVVGHQGEGRTEIVGGLKPGDVVVAKGAILLLNEVSP